MLASRPEVFVGVMTEKLMTYALGRGVEYYDMPAVRKIVQDAATHDFRFSSLIAGVVKSTPFQMKVKGLWEGRSGKRRSDACRGRPPLAPASESDNTGV